ncbi:MAG: NAD(P)-dependent oxidoreductase [bacterium]|nr:NAD(P)-dependent oxidoreductase [bacterium]
MKILVTGGAGYLGSVLSLDLLRTGQEVRVFDNLMYGGRPVLALLGQDGFEFVRGDIRDKKAIRDALRDVDSVVHLAAIVGDPACARQPELAKAVNVQATLDLVETAREAGVSRFVFASTCSNYGKMSDTSILADENCEVRPLSLYAETKVAVEKEILELSARPLAVTVLRFATLYGLSPRMRFDLTVNQFVMEMLTERRTVVYGELFWRPYVHVRDAARAIVAVLGAPQAAAAQQVFNVGDSRENYRKLDLVEIIQKRVGACDVQFVHKAEDPRDYRVSFERIRERLGYAVTRRVPDGVHEIANAIESGSLDDLGNPLYYNVKLA